MQTLKIEIPKGYEVDSFDKLSGEIRFKEKPREVTDRIKTIDDVLADNQLTREDFDYQCNGLTDDERAYNAPPGHWQRRGAHHRARRWRQRQ